MLRKTIRSRFALPLYRLLSTQSKPAPTSTVKRSIVQREYQDSKEQWVREEPEENEIKLTEREQKIEEDRKRLKWQQTPEEAQVWRTKFSTFLNNENDSAWLQWVQQPWDLRPSNLMRMWRDWKVRKEAYFQSYIKERVQILGPDLATIHFILYRDGYIK